VSSSNFIRNGLPQPNCNQSRKGNDQGRTKLQATRWGGHLLPGDTIQAALYIAQNPSNNVAGIFNLQAGSPRIHDCKLPIVKRWIVRNLRIYSRLLDIRV
jgi:hypothetical protein